MSELDHGCAAIRPLLFAAIDDEVSRAERLEVYAHLATCESCRSWERSERALTALLTDGWSRRRLPAWMAGRRRIRSRVLAAVSALAVSTLVLLVLPAAAPRGSVVQRELGPGMEWQVVGERAVGGRDVIDVPAAGAATVRLGESVRLETVGPTRLELALHGHRWGVAVLAGTLLATVAADGALAVGPAATQELRVGRWRLSAADAVQRAAHSATQDPAPGDTATLLAEGLGRFASAGSALLHDPAGERAHLAAAERSLRAVLAAKDATPAQARQAMFYLAASVARQGRDDEAFQLESEWLARFPEGEEASPVRFFMANHLRKKGRLEEARLLFQRVVRDEGDSPLGVAARHYLDLPAGRPDATPQEPEAERLSARRAPPPGVPRAGGYLVVRVALDAARDAGYAAAARAARAFHRGEEWAWDGVDFAALARRLRERPPENVLFVLRPEQLDLVLHRRLLLLSAGIDDDWFLDFAFGYLTAESGAGCEQLWQRIVAMHGRGKLSGSWWQASVTENATSLVHEDAPPPLAAGAGFRGPHYYWSTVDPDREAMIARSLEEARSAAVMTITGCGDPQGIWLFDDRRNLQRERHWDYRPERVGQDPDRSMPRLVASRFRSLQLDAPVLWSGTCHSGAVCRVFVESDIVSTFGRTERATVHRLAPTDSLALSWLAAGAASLLVPLGANHGMSVAMEIDFALRHGASLGETIKSTWDDVLLAAQGRLVLDLPVDGEPHRNSEQIMQGGGANRILIGDPALRPFRAVTGAAEVVKVERTKNGLRVTVERTAGWQPRAWDMFGTARDRDWRVLARVDLGPVGLAQAADFTASVAACSPAGAHLPYAMRRLAIEDYHGRRYLHLQANGPRGALDGRACEVVFEVVAQ